MQKDQVNSPVQDMTKRPSFYFSKNKSEAKSISPTEADNIKISRPAVGNLNFADAMNDKGRTRTESLIEINQRNQSLDPKTSSRDKKDAELMSKGIYVNILIIRISCI